MTKAWRVLYIAAATGDDDVYGMQRATQVNYIVDVYRKHKLVSD